MKHLSIISILLLLLGSTGAMVFHHSAFAPIAQLVIDGTHPPDGSDPSGRSHPFKPKLGADLSTGTEAENFTYLNFHEASKKFPYYGTASFLWLIGFGLWIYQFGLRTDHHDKKIVIAGLVITLLGLRNLYRATANGIESFDTMPVPEEGFDPSLLTTSLGAASQTNLYGWITLAAGAICLLIAWLLGRRSRTTIPPPGKVGTILSVIAMILCGLAAGVLVLHFITGRGFADVESGIEISEIARDVSIFLLSQVFTVFLLFVAGLVVTASVCLKHRK